MPVPTELDRDAVQLLERGGQLQQLRLGVDPVPWVLALIQVEPISSRWCSARMLKEVVIPMARPSHERRTAPGDDEAGCVLLEAMSEIRRVADRFSSVHGWAVR